MIEYGKMQELKVVKTSQNWYILNAKNDTQNSVLLPISLAPKDIRIGDKIEVFVYRDTKERIMASIKKPRLVLGETAALTVVDTTEFGAFLDWGLEKDLLLPLKEQVGEVKKGGTYLVGLALNNSHQLYATMKIYDSLKINAPYKENDNAHGTVYNFNPEFGAFVAVDNQYHGMIPNKELYGSIAIGDKVDVRIKKVRQDGKLELSLRQEIAQQIETDARVIFEKLKANGGVLKLNDRSSPEKIKSELKMSKSAFKRALGRLLKEGAVQITDDAIRLMW
ncbi:MULTISPECIES: S1-like domain-containing RNA-binding protein [unclassified Dehalobacter]|uniref:CvfB family protein n=1 Tax=unclassified Dehalobacter TaxID=2635733 RepID=UPI000E6D436D|nr:MULTISPECIES: S1-like domain-containing RNA-binding protein [unclassified Dehalobacter]RJE48590.1 RNA-binding protein [Dehalobacter sp. MCB1]TCX46727.1 RNA-binding protein [Dehalobacter sp. 14DCB1]TCX51242.1 RNA-binding protein [Dehalobacter sp. 12DCB1]